MAAEDVQIVVTNKNQLQLFEDGSATYFMHYSCKDGKRERDNGNDIIVHKDSLPYIKESHMCLYPHVVPLGYVVHHHIDPIVLLLPIFHM